MPAFAGMTISAYSTSFRPGERSEREVESSNRRTLLWIIALPRRRCVLEPAFAGMTNLLSVHSGRASAASERWNCRDAGAYWMLAFAGMTNLLSVIPAGRAQRSESRNPVDAGRGCGGCRSAPHRDAGAYWMPAFAGMTIAGYSVIRASAAKRGLGSSAVDRKALWAGVKPACTSPRTVFCVIGQASPLHGDLDEVLLGNAVGRLLGALLAFPRLRAILFRFADHNATPSTGRGRTSRAGKRSVPCRTSAHGALLLLRARRRIRNANGLAVWTPSR
jgi:hypothetical protein